MEALVDSAMRDGAIGLSTSLIYLPAMNIKYVVTSGPRPCTAPTNFPPQSYRTWLPPATRQLFIAKRLSTP